MPFNLDCPALSIGPPDLGFEPGEFSQAWPTKYDAPDFNAKGNDVAIDALTLSVERLERA